MKIIAGLGNPGVKYNFTRHNSGFLALDFYFKLNHLTWDEKPLYGAIKAQKDDVLFLKPQDFYNDSGRAIGVAARYYKVNPSDILVICDNFDLEFGKIRCRKIGVSGGNNGLKSVTAELKTDNYPRIRIGTGNDALRQKLGDIDFVLRKFTPEEREKLSTILRGVADKIDEFIRS